MELEKILEGDVDLHQNALSQNNTEIPSVLLSNQFQILFISLSLPMCLPVSAKIDGHLLFNIAKCVSVVNITLILTHDCTK